jgi:hypothetical protein
MGAAPAAEKRDPHLALPRPLQIARMAEAAFIVVTAYVAVSLPLGQVPGGAMVLLRLLVEAAVALTVLLALPRHPEPTRIVAMVLAAFVLVGCVPHVLFTIPRLFAPHTALDALSLVITLAACGAQAIVLFTCASVRRPPAPS